MELRSRARAVVIFTRADVYRVMHDRGDKFGTPRLKTEIADAVLVKAQQAIEDAARAALAKTLEKHVAEFWAQMEAAMPDNMVHSDDQKQF